MMCRYHLSVGHAGVSRARLHIFLSVIVIMTVVIICFAFRDSTGEHNCRIMVFYDNFVFVESDPLMDRFTVLLLVTFFLLIQDSFCNERSLRKISNYLFYYDSYILIIYITILLARRKITYFI